jgi:hypothetical protein
VISGRRSRCRRDRRCNSRSWRRNNRVAAPWLDWSAKAFLPLRQEILQCVAAVAAALVGQLAVLEEELDGQGGTQRKHGEGNKGIKVSTQVRYIQVLYIV